MDTELNNQQGGGVVFTSSGESGVKTENTTAPFTASVASRPVRIFSHQKTFLYSFVSILIVCIFYFFAAFYLSWWPFGKKMDQAAATSSERDQEMPVTREFFSNLTGYKNTPDLPGLYILLQSNAPVSKKGEWALVKMIRERDNAEVAVLGFPDGRNREYPKSVSVSPDEKFLTYVSDEKKIRLEKLDTGELVWESPACDSAVPIFEGKENSVLWGLCEFQKKIQLWYDGKMVATFDSNFDTLSPKNSLRSAEGSILISAMSASLSGDTETNATVYAGKINGVPAYVYNGKLITLDGAKNMATLGFFQGKHTYEIDYPDKMVFYQGDDVIGTLVPGSMTDTGVGEESEESKFYSLLLQKAPSRDAIGDKRFAIVQADEQQATYLKKKADHQKRFNAYLKKKNENSSISFSEEEDPVENRFDQEGESIERQKGKYFVKVIGETGEISRKAYDRISEVKYDHSGKHLAYLAVDGKEVVLVVDEQEVLRGNIELLYWLEDGRWMTTGRKVFNFSDGKKVEKGEITSDSLSFSQPLFQPHKGALVWNATEYMPDPSNGSRSIQFVGERVYLDGQPITEKRFESVQKDVVLAPDEDPVYIIGQDMDSQRMIQTRVVMKGDQPLYMTKGYMPLGLYPFKEGVGFYEKESRESSKLLWKYIPYTTRLNEASLASYNNAVVRGGESSTSSNTSTVPNAKHSEIPVPSLPLKSSYSPLSDAELKRYTEPTKKNILTNIKFDPVLGKRTAPVAVIIYGDHSGGNAYSFHYQAYLNLKKDFIDTGKVQYVFRENYSGSTETKEGRLNTIGRCVQKLKGDETFYIFHELVVSKKPNISEPVSDTDLASIVESFGLSMGTIQSCTETPEIKKIANPPFESWMEGEGVSYLIGNVGANGEFLGDGYIFYDYATLQRLLEKYQGKEPPPQKVPTASELSTASSQIYALAEIASSLAQGCVQTWGTLKAGASGEPNCIRSGGSTGTWPDISKVCGDIGTARNTWEVQQRDKEWSLRLLCAKVPECGTEKNLVCTSSGCSSPSGHCKK